jgi:glycosyltransferase involved in cell wall biosynthesis
MSASSRANGARLHGANVAFVLPSLERGGAERQAFLLARHLVRHEGARVLMVSLGNVGGIGEACRRKQIPCAAFRLRHPGRGFAMKVLDLVRFAAFLRRHRVDVVLPYCMFPNVLCALSWRLGGARVCVWNQRDEGRDRMSTRLERAAVSQVRCFVANSSHGAAFLRSALDVPADAIQVIHNGIELSPAAATRAQWRADLGIEPDAFAACMVANLHRYKDHATLVAAWARVVEALAGRGRRAYLLLAGAFRDRYEPLLAQVRSLGLTDDVRFLGEVGDVAGLLQAVDLAVFSSQAEGLPNAVLEAMASGLAVAATDYPGIREAMGPEGALLLAQPGDPVDLAHKIVTAAVDPELRAALGERARRRVEAEFTIDRMGRRMADVIAGQYARAERQHQAFARWRAAARGTD